MEPQIEVVKDYDGNFETLVRGWVKRKKESGKPFTHTKIRVAAYPWLPSAVRYVSDDQTITLEFYSALRAGFGSLSEKDIEELIELL